MFVIILYVAELSRNLKNVYDNIKVVDYAVEEIISMIETQVHNNWSFTRFMFVWRHSYCKYMWYIKLEYSRYQTYSSSLSRLFCIKSLSTNIIFLIFGRRNIQLWNECALEKFSLLEGKLDYTAKSKTQSYWNEKWNKFATTNVLISIFQRLNSFLFFVSSIKTLSFDGAFLYL